MEKSNAIFKMTMEKVCPFTAVKVLDNGDIQGPLRLNDRPYARLKSLYQCPAKVFLSHDRGVIAVDLSYGGEETASVMRRHWRSVIDGRCVKAGQCLVLVDETGNDDRREDENGNKEDWAAYNARIVNNHGGVIDVRTAVKFRVSVYGLDKDEMKLVM